MAEGTFPPPGADEATVDDPAGLDARQGFVVQTQPDTGALEGILEGLIRECTAEFRWVRSELKKRPKRSERGLIEQGKLEVAAMRSAQLLRASMGAAGGGNRGGSYEDWVMKALEHEGAAQL